jgi:hypothetical protein
MAQANYSISSPYYNTPQNSYYLGFWQPPNITASNTDNFIVLPKKYTNRPDLLSHDLYGTSKLWWVFTMLNPNVLKDPVFDMKAGIELRVPSLTGVQSFL